MCVPYPTCPWSEVSIVCHNVIVVRLGLFLPLTCSVLLAACRLPAIDTCKSPRWKTPPPLPGTIVPSYPGGRGWIWRRACLLMVFWGS